MTFLVCTLCAFSARGASFDCGKAQRKVEHLICDNPEISKLDDDLAASYKAALQGQRQVDAIKQAPKQWLKERNVCPDVDCLDHANTDPDGKPLGLGNDTTYGGKGNNYYILSNGDNYLDAGSGNDYIGAGVGNNTIFGGAMLIEADNDRRYMLGLSPVPILIRAVNDAVFEMRRWG